MWYVIQVINGREDVMRERIECMVPASAMQELFYPQFQTEIKVHGEWVNTTKPLFPGYLICDTADPRTVQQYLKMCISQEVTRVSGKSRRDACDAIRRMASDSRLSKVISDYPCERLGFTQRVFVELLRRRAASILYMAASSGVF